MLVTTFENNRRNISKNIVKLNLKQSTNLYCITIWSTYVQRKHIFDKPNLVSLTYCDFNSYLVIPRFIHKFKITGWLQGHFLTFHPSEIDVMSTRNFW